jgi:hypothetical protein
MLANKGAGLSRKERNFINGLRNITDYQVKCVCLLQKLFERSDGTHPHPSELTEEEREMLTDKVIVSIHRDYMKLDETEQAGFKEFLQMLSVLGAA